jgi:hypothetical protein
MRILSDGLRHAISFGGTARAMIVVMAGIAILGVLLGMTMRRGWPSRIIAAFR